MAVDREIAKSFDKLIEGIALPRDRRPQKRPNLELPSNTVIVSVDSHWSAYEDIFYDAFPPHLKHKAPRPVIKGARHA